MRDAGNRNRTHIFPGDTGKPPEPKDAQASPEGSVRDAGNRSRTRNPPRRMESYFMGIVTPGELQGPTSYKQMLKHPERVGYEEAIRVEHQSMDEKEVWTLVERPAGKKIMTTKWVFTKKEDGRFRARCVARGYTGVYGVDYFETNSPTVKDATLRIMLVVANQVQLDVEHLDIKTAYLNAVLEEEVYIEIPEGIEIAGARPGMVLKLNKALYGLKQAGRAWYYKLVEIMREMGFSPLRHDSCCFRNKKTHVLVYVDDLLLIGTTTDVTTFKAMIAARLDIKDLKAVSKYVGIGVTRTPSEIILSQEGHVGEFLSVVGMGESRKTGCPIEPGTQMVKGEPNPEFKKYQQAVGMLNYITTKSRPDLSYVAGKLCKFMMCADESHMKVVHQVARYLQSTRGVGLHFARIDDGKGWDHVFNLVVHTDANFGDASECGHCTSGMVLLIDGNVVIWKSSKQTVVAPCTAVSEYIGMDLGVTGAEWAIGLFRELGLRVRMDRVMVRCDNTAAVATGLNPGVSEKMKVVVAKYWLVKDVLERGDIALSRVDTTKNKADALTKAVGTKGMADFRKYCRLVDGGVLKIDCDEDSDWAEDRAEGKREGKFPA